MRVSVSSKEITCVTFDLGWNNVQGSNGVWVKNEGVQVVSDDCVLNNCGYFDGHSFLSIPFFKNNYHKNGFTVSFFFKSKIASAGVPLAMISNDCSPSDYVTTNTVGSLRIQHYDGILAAVVQQEQMITAGVHGWVSTCLQACFRCHRPLSRRLDRCDRVIHNESGDPNGGNMCSFLGATCTSRVRHNADYVPYVKIRFDL